MSARFHCPGPLQAGEQALPESVFRHAVQVLRLRPGEAVTLFDGSGLDYPGVLGAVGRREARVTLAVPQLLDVESPLRITLAQGISKGERMDFALQKAVELGVQTIQPLITERCVVRLDGERWEKKLEHWQGVIVAACEQSGRSRLPQLAPVARLDAWLSAPLPEGARLTLDPEAGTRLRDLPAATAAVLLIGPEGGLSRREIDAAGQAGFTALRLGPRVLRTETAALATLAALQAAWGDLG